MYQLSYSSFFRVEGTEFENLSALENPQNRHQVRELARLVFRETQKNQRAFSWGRSGMYLRDVGDLSEEASDEN